MTSEDGWVKAAASGGNGGSCVEVTYRKADASNVSDGCVEVGYHKAEASSNNGSCVEVGVADPDNCSQCHSLPPVKAGQALVLVRDSKDPDGPHLHFTTVEWVAFLDGVGKSEFTLEALASGVAST